MKTSITVEEAQEALNNAHRTVENWRLQKRTFDNAAREKPANERAVAENMAKLLQACIDEMTSALGDTRSPGKWKADLLQEMREVLERHNG